MKHGGSKNSKFGSEGARNQKIEKLNENGSMRPFYTITAQSALSDRIAENHLLSEHGVGYIGNDYGYLGDNPQALIGLCCEKYGVSLAYYPAIKLAKDLKLETRAIIPGFEFLQLGILTDDDVEAHRTSAENLLKKARIKQFDTINDTDYKTKRLEYMFKILPYISAKNLDDIDISAEMVKKLMTATETADILLALEEKDTVVIADQGSAGPIIQAKNIAEKFGIENVLSGIIYLEPPDLQNENFMYYADIGNKILLNSEPGNEAVKILRAKTAGGTKEQFKSEGGNYYNCAVGEVDSIIANGSGTVYEKCGNGSFEGCGECKQQVKKKIEKFLKDINSGQHETFRNN